MSTPAASITLPEDTRQRILSAAMQLFGQAGYARATTRAIAKAAGVNEVTLFRHFGSKKQLLSACIAARNQAGFSANFETCLTGNYPQDILAMARLQIQDTRANLDILRLLLCDARSIPELRQAMLVGGRANLALLSAYFQSQVDQGIIRPGLPAEVLATAFDSLFSSYILFENLLHDNLAPHTAVEQALQPLVDLFVHGTYSQVDSSG